MEAKDFSAGTRSARKLTTSICFALGLLIVAVFAQTFQHGFIFYDDDHYVYENATVKNGLTVKGAIWAFTTFTAANWHPVTWLSHMLDCQIFGLRPGWHHAMNVALHAATTVLLFLLLFRMTHTVWRSALAAAIFAIHPLHVESVAWIAERKDVLSALFGVWAIRQYLRYVETGRRLSYAGIIVLFALALMAKPMLVTLPFLLLLLDVWPVRRIEWTSGPAKWWPLVREKLPLFAMAAVAGVLTFLAQQSGKAVIALTQRTPGERLENAIVSYAAYLRKIFWPVGLGVYYPYSQPGLWEVLGAAALLLAITGVAVLMARHYPYVLTGWLWFLGTLVPVIGLVQVGTQSMADRYTYLPLIGILFGAIWLAGDLLRKVPAMRQPAAAVSLLVIGALAAQSYRQTQYWRNSEALFEHTLAVTSRNGIIHNNLGVVMARAGRLGDAELHFEKAVEFNPDYAEAHSNLGSMLAASGRLSDAVAHFRRAVELKPDYKEGHGNLCIALRQMGHVQEAIHQCSEALRLDPGYLKARYHLAIALAATGDRERAMAELSRVLTVAPDDAPAREAFTWLQSGRR